MRTDSVSLLLAAFFLTPDKPDGTSICVEICSLERFAEGTGLFCQRLWSKLGKMDRATLCRCVYEETANGKIEIVN